MRRWGGLGYWVTVGLMMAMLCAPAGAALAQGPSAQQAAMTHVVARGENLYRIGLRYGVSVQALAWANGLRNPNAVYAGQRLVIPNRVGANPPASTPAPQQPGPAVGSCKEIV